MKYYGNWINHPHYRINMDDTAVLLSCTPNRTLHFEGDRTVSVMIAGTSSIIFTLAISVEIYETRLPLFVIFKATLGGSF